MFQKQNAEAIQEMTTKHGVKIMTTPKEINEEFLKVWDKVAAGGKVEEPVLQEGL